MHTLALTQYENATVTTPYDNLANHATFGLAGLLVFVTVTVIVIAVRRKCRKNRSRHSSADPDEPPICAPSQQEVSYEQPVFVSTPTLNRKSESWTSEKWSHLAEDIKWMLKGHVIERERIRLGNVIGEGEFGWVYEATLAPRSSQTSSDYCSASTQTVAVKTLKGQSLSDDSVESFLKEGMIMKAFNHRNVLSLIGVAIDDQGIPLIVVPFMPNGCLKKYIMKPSIVFTVRELLSFGHQVALGMKYLSELRFVHRDLATRNCMLDERLVVKIADFGLSRDLYSRDYYASSDRFARLPVRWMAPECLTVARYTVKSDVWSYAVLLWELLTRGSVPYSDVSNWDIQSYILSGQRMSQPDVCPDEVYRLMLRCWSKEPADRPNFEEICDFFDMLLQEDLISNDETTDQDYINLLLSVELNSVEEVNSKAPPVASSV